MFLRQIGRSCLLCSVGKIDSLFFCGIFTGFNGKGVVNIVYMLLFIVCIAVCIPFFLLFGWQTKEKLYKLQTNIQRIWKLPINLIYANCRIVLWWTIVLKKKKKRRTFHFRCCKKKNCWCVVWVSVLIHIYFRLVWCASQMNTTHARESILRSEFQLNWTTTKKKFFIIWLGRIEKSMK